ncbi:MAG: PAS domain-containing protein, partial [Chthoniobacteraceae bacterium]
MKESNTVRRVSQRVAPPRRRRHVARHSSPLIRIATPESAAITLRKSAHRFSGIIEKLPVAFYLCDYEGRILLANECAEQLWGRKPRIGVDSWCGSWRIYRSDGTEIPLAECPMAVALRDGQSIRGHELIVERPDGGRSWVIPHPDPIFDDDGALAGAANVLVDITPQREAENLLRRSHDELERRVEERAADLARIQCSLALAQQASGSGMWDWDAESDELFTTHEFRQLFGYDDSRRITWEAWMGLMHPDDREMVKLKMKELFESGRDLRL